MNLETIAKKVEEIRARVYNTRYDEKRKQDGPGAPIGNQNAKGPHKKKYSNSKLAKQLVGKSTGDGRKIKAMGQHADDEARDRKIYYPSIANALAQKPKKSYKNRSVYDFRGTRVVVEDDVIITVVDRRGKNDNGEDIGGKGKKKKNKR